MASCPLRKCQGKRGCLCPSRPPPFIYSKTTDKEPTVQEAIPVVRNEFKRRTPKYIGENSPDTGQVTRIKNSPKKDKNTSQKLSTTLPQSVSSAELEEEKDGSCVPDSAAINDDLEPENDGGSGNVKINYNHYKKEFPLVGGSISSDVVDSEYCLTFAFPKCKIHLSTYSPNDFSFEDKGLSAPPLEKESPPGTFINIKTDTVYWVHLEEDHDEQQAYELRQDKFAKEAAEKRRVAESSAAKGLPQVSSAESCSCIEGNPCMDRYGCKNWANRYEIAKQNGWKGKDMLLQFHAFCYWNC